jgi:hypothetical protein
MSYGRNDAERYRLVGVYAGRVLKRQAIYWCMFHLNSRLYVRGPIESGHQLIRGEDGVSVGRAVDFHDGVHRLR